MDIVKAFNSNDLHTEIIIKGDVQNPLFRASDIGLVLDMGNIRTTINDFNETEKVVHSMDTHLNLRCKVYVVDFVRVKRI